MSNKIKNQTTSEKISELAKQTGLILMAGAATLGMLDTSERFGNKVVVPNQPAFAMVNNTPTNGGQGNSFLREREEAAPHYINYSVVQRTAARSGKI